MVEVVEVVDVVLVVSEVVVVVDTQSLAVPELQLQKVLPHEGLGLVPVHTHVPWELLHDTEFCGMVVVDVVVVVVVVGRVVVVDTQLPLTSVPDEHGHVFDGVLVPQDGDVPSQRHWYGALLHETSPTGSSVVVDVVVVVVVDGGLIPEIVDVTVFW